MTQPVPWPDTAALLLRRLFQQLVTAGGLTHLQGRALLTSELAPGLSEFAVTGARDPDHGGWDGDDLVLRRTYEGYVAVHYRADTNQHLTFPDEARIAAVLATFDRLPAVQADDAFISLGMSPAQWYLNELPTRTGQPAVLTLLFEWSLTADLRLPPP